MSTLDDKLEEMARIKAELQRMEADDSITEEDSADLRDTMIARWEQLDTESKPIIRQMERLKGITHSADNPANLEGGDGSAAPAARRSAEFMQRMDPYADLDGVTSAMVSRNDMIARSLSAIEMDSATAVSSIPKLRRRPGRRSSTRGSPGMCC